MFTNNYITYRKQAFQGLYDSTYKTPDGTSRKMYHPTIRDGDIGQWLPKARCLEVCTTSKTGSYPDSIIYPGVYFGSGSTPATKNDHTLASPITSGLAITNPAALVFRDVGNGKYEVFADYIVRNTSGAEINIYEIGVFSPVNASSNGNYGSSSNVWWLALMERTALAAPITILPGESKLVTHRLTFNQTMNVE